MKIVREHISFERPSSEKDFRDNLLYPEKPLSVVRSHNNDYGRFMYHMIPGSDMKNVYMIMSSKDIGVSISQHFWYNKKENYFYTTQDNWNWEKPGNYGMEIFKENDIKFIIKNIKSSVKEFNYIIIPGYQFKWNIKKPT